MGDGLLVKLKILKPEAERGAGKVTAPEPEAEETVRPTPRSRRASVLSESPTASPDVAVAEIRKTLHTALKKAAADESGFSYFNFCTVLEKLSKHLTDEAALYAAAGAAGSSMKATADSLVLSAKGCLDILEDERKTFSTEMAEVENQLSEDQAELKDVNKQLAALEAQKQALEARIAEAKSNIDSGMSAFETASAEIAGEIKDRISKIKKYV